MSINELWGLEELNLQDVRESRLSQEAVNNFVAGLSRLKKLTLTYEFRGMEGYQHVSCPILCVRQESKSEGCNWPD